MSLDLSSLAVCVGISLEAKGPNLSKNSLDKYSCRGLLETQNIKINGGFPMSGTMRRDTGQQGLILNAEGNPLLLYWFE